MNTLVYSIYRMEDYFLKRNHIIRFYFSKCGLKNIGASRLLGAKHLSPIMITEIASTELFLGPDYLRDGYSLLNCCINESPHFGFMQALKTGESITETDYMQRYIEGSLDWRRGAIKPKNMERFFDKFSESQADIISGKSRPITTYIVGGRYYIFDGKHRAALCALLGVPVKCAVVGSEIANADLWHYMFTLLEGKSEYSKHTQFHNLYLQELNNNERK